MHQFIMTELLLLISAHHFLLFVLLICFRQEKLNLLKHKTLSVCNKGIFEEIELSAV
jgi:hypothetical protein